MVSLGEPAALVAIDRTRAQALGIEGGPVWDKPDVGLDAATFEAPTEVHLSVTSRCPVGCRGCYVDARPQGHQPSFEELRERLEALAGAGVFRVAFGGGEALLRDDLDRLAAVAVELGIEPTMTTSGLGLTPQRASRLRGFAQINVSWDGPEGVYEQVRGVGKAPREMAVRAIDALLGAGITVGINTVLTQVNFGSLAAIAAEAYELGATELQLLRYKPAGRATLDYLESRLSLAQREALPNVLREIVEREQIRVRIDCSMIPYFSRDETIDVMTMRAWGVQGCEGGRSLMTVGAEGKVAPCSFWPKGGEGMSLSDPDAWFKDSALEGFRHHAQNPPAPCSSCGCRTTRRWGTLFGRRAACRAASDS